MKPAHQIVIIFLIVQILAIFTGSVIMADQNNNPYVNQFYVKNTDGFEASFFYLGAVLFGAFIMVLLIRHVKNLKIFFILEFLVLSSASSVVFYSLGRIFLNYEIAMTIGVALGLSLGLLKFFIQSLKNISATLSSAGAGAILGASIGFYPAVLFMVLLSIYDYIAVFKTKHMVEMANYMKDKNLAFTVTAKTYLPETKKESRIDLGTGDLIAPAFVSVASFELGHYAPLFIIFGSAVSLFLFLKFALKRRMVLPALPPLTAGCILSILIWYVALLMRLV